MQCRTSRINFRLVVHLPLSEFSLFLWLTTSTEMEPFDSEAGDRLSEGEVRKKKSLAFLLELIAIVSHVSAIATGVVASAYPIRGLIVTSSVLATVSLALTTKARKQRRDVNNAVRRNEQPPVGTLGPLG